MNNLWQNVDICGEAICHQKSFLFDYSGKDESRLEDRLRWCNKCYLLYSKSCMVRENDIPK